MEKVSEKSPKEQKRTVSVILYEDGIDSQNMENKVKRFKKTITVQHSILEERKTQIEELLNMLNSKDQEIKDKNLKLEALRFKDECLFDEVKKLKNIEVENAALKVASSIQLSEISRLKSIGDEYKKKFLDLKRDKRSKIEEGELSIEEIQDSQERNIAALKEELINLSEQYRKLKEKNDELEERIYLKSKQVNSLREERNNILESDNVDQLSKILDLEKKNSDQRDELREAISSLKDTNDKIYKLKRKVNKLHNLANDRYDEINNLSKSNKRLKIRQAAMKEEYKQLKDENKDLLKDLSREITLNEFYENEKKLESEEESEIRVHRILTCASVVESLLTSVEKELINRL